MAHDKRVNWYGFLLNDYKDLVGVYALYDKNNNLLYIGETTDLKSRTINHFGDSRFSDMIYKIVFYEVGLLNRMNLEFIMIDLCKPIFNIQNQDLYMKGKKHELIRDLTLPEYECKCRTCKPWLKEHQLKMKKESETKKRSDEWYRKRRENRLRMRHQLSIDDLE